MRKFLTSTLVQITCLLLAMQALGENDRDTQRFETLMTPEEYHAAGLDKLTEEERAALYQWVREHGDKARSQGSPSNVVHPSGSAATAVVPPSTDPPQGKPAVSEVPAPQGSAVAVSAPAQVTPNPSPEIREQSIPATEDKNFGFPEPPPEPEESARQLHARIVSPFRGWSGKTVFQLDNGQVWRQRSSGRHTYTGEDTRVVISKNSWGFYEMRLLDTNRSIGVKRVR